MYLEVIAFAALISTQIIIGCICYYVGFVNATVKSQKRFVKLMQDMQLLQARASMKHGVPPPPASADKNKTNLKIFRFDKKNEDLTPSK